MIYIVMRTDDACALSDHEHERNVFELFEQYNVPQVVAVTPKVVDDPHNDRSSAYYPLHENPSMLNLLREYREKGLVEIAQHGFSHQTNRFRPSRVYEISDGDYFPGIDRRWLPYKPAVDNEYSEFNGLPVGEQREKVILGREYLKEQFGGEIKTFIFPWDSYSMDALEILRDNKTEVVLCEHARFQIDGLYVVGSCCWDVGWFPELIAGALKQSKTLLMHLAYHSWEVDGPKRSKLEEALKIISGNKNIKCVLPHQVPEIPHVKAVLSADTRCRNIAAEANRYLKAEIAGRPYYTFDPMYYRRRSLAARLVFLIAKYFGITWLFISTAAALGSVVLAGLLAYLHSGEISAWYYPSVTVLGALLFGTELLWARERRAQKQ